MSFRSRRGLPGRSYHRRGVASLVTGACSCILVGMRKELVGEGSSSRETALAGLVDNARAYYDSGVTRALPFRTEQLRRLRAALLAYEEPLYGALAADLHKPREESYLTEIFLTVREIDFALRRLRRWARPERVPTDLTAMPARSRRRPEPLGVVLIISPWNYPVQLSLIPLVGAIAAGNTVLLKPSELAPRTSETLARLVAEAFPPGHVTVVEGGPETARRLLEQPFDHIFFTGGGRVARHILRAAAEHLTPVTLELGGKSPCVIDATADLTLAARRIAYARFLNAGQTCVAPDYLLVQRSVKARFVDALRAQLAAWWGTGEAPLEEFSRIVSERHFDRLVGLLGAATAAGARVVHGGAASRPERYIAPTLVDRVAGDSPLMQEELFGPLLPILEYDDERDALARISSLPRPLAAYLFSRDRGAQHRFEVEVSAGGICMNDCLTHMTTTHLPFGGVGASGMGAYHGEASFAVFSHYKSVLAKRGRLELPVRYPPYQRRGRLIRLVRRLFS